MKKLMLLVLGVVGMIWILQGLDPPPPKTDDSSKRPDSSSKALKEPAITAVPPVSDDQPERLTNDIAVVVEKVERAGIIFRGECLYAGDANDANRRKEARQPVVQWNLDQDKRHQSYVARPAL
jgi:hypothetical protein